MFLWREPGLDVNMATKSDPGATWTAPILVPELSSTGLEYRTSLSGDARISVFNSTRSGALELWLAEREDPEVPFGPPTQDLLANLTTTTGDYDPELSVDGLTLYFTRQVDGGRRLMRTTRATTSAAFDAPVELGEYGSDVHDPSLSPDQLVISYVVFTPPQRVEYRSRADIGQDFGEPTQLASVHEASDLELSPDGCELYYRAVAAPTSLWVAPIE
ncbi:MAG: hypothetical protein SFX73_05430 [Kofleriaceae bacterium]|nr:hypothetical protein [Kofleriaceae bacterium]